MKKFFGVLRYVKGYWRYGILNISFNLLSVIFSTFSIVMVFPFLQMLFSEDNTKMEMLVRGGKNHLGFSTTEILDTIDYYLAKQTLDYGKMPVLIWICVFVVVTFFLKNLTIH